MIHISCFSWTHLCLVHVSMFMSVLPGLVNTFDVLMSYKWCWYFKTWNYIWWTIGWNPFFLSLNTLDHAMNRLLIYVVEWIRISGNALIISSHFIFISTFSISIPFCLSLPLSLVSFLSPSSFPVSFSPSSVPSFLSTFKHCCFCVCCYQKVSLPRTLTRLSFQFSFLNPEQIFPKSHILN